jgi:hypothetical protein
MLRIVLVCAVLMAPALAAQDSEPLSGSVPSQRRLSYLYSIDFGPATVSYSLACNLMTPSAAGLIVRLIDVDLLAGSGALVPPGVDEHVLSGVGTANVALSGMYSGVHDFMVEVESPGAGSTFTGSLTGSMGAIDFISSDQLVLTATAFAPRWAGAACGTAASLAASLWPPASSSTWARFRARSFSASRPWAATSMKSS